MGTFTSRGNLYKSAADGSENVNVVTDLNNNMDRLDALLGWRPVTSGTMPASAFQGAPMFQTDTGRGYLNTSAGASAAYVQVMVAGADWASNITMSSSAQQILIGGAPANATFGVRRAAGSDLVYSSRTFTASASSMYAILADGTMAWGPGTSGTDTNLRRVSADVLGTDDSFQVGGGLTVGGATALADVAVSGSMAVNGATVRPQLHTGTTVASTASETVIQTVTIPAGDAVIGATYRIRVGGSAAVTGTPSITFRGKIGGVAGTALVNVSPIVTRSGMTDGSWDVEILLTCTTVGASATWSGIIKIGHNFLTNATTYNTVGPISFSGVVRDSTAAQDFVLTVQWSASSPSNTITARTGNSGREC